MNVTYLPIILGSDENAYGTVRLFRDFCPTRPLLVCTRRLTPTLDSSLFDIKLIEGFDREEVFAPALRALLEEKRGEYDKLLVIPCADYYAAMLSKHAPLFGDLIANPPIPFSLFDTLDTKDKFYALCEKHGLAYPKTVVATPDTRESVLETLPFDFPIVVKPENSNATDYLHCSFAGKEKVFFFDTKEDYLRVIRAMNQSTYKGKLILQEMIPGGDDAMRTMNCYCDKDGKVRAMCLGQPVLEEYAPKMKGNYAAILSRFDMALYRQMKAFLEELGYLGFANFDFKYDRRNGRYVLFEINPRLGRSSFFVYAAGINMMQVMSEDCVFDRRTDCIFSDKTALWTAVPKGILKKYVSDPALVAEMKALWKHTPPLRTLFCKEEKSLKRKLRLTRYFYAAYRTYGKYFFRKDN